MTKNSILNLINKTTFILSVAAFTLLLSCKSETKSETEAKTLPQYETIREMLEDSGDFYEENGSLKFISEEKSNIHIQVSKPISKNDLENAKEEIVKRDIVYVAFQTFAQTNLNELTITSLPLDFENKRKYYKKHQKTLKIDRTRAKSILKEYLNSNDFSILFNLENGIWLPNKSFDKLKFQKLEEVYNKMRVNQ
ncbi:hypothetical protein [Aquimarina macrocephali]|uniref:hypothetical protein n=1 Tax=Aquimarina macrocephali TaxID=666563 RepID=UPI000464F38C|nr:hypothetical protein [Aquimarina macrocephali]